MPPLSATVPAGAPRVPGAVAASAVRGGRAPGGGRTRGSALLATFWAIMILSLAVAGWFVWMQERLRVHGESTLAAEALAMAHSGLAVALNPKVDRYSSLLEAQLGPEQGYRVQVQSEGGRMNLAWILTGEDPRKLAVFKQWLEWVVGVDLQSRDRLVDCLLDYVDADNIARLNGQEDKGDYHPANRMIQSLDELKRIPGLEPLLSFPGWRDWFTLDSSGPFDLMEVPEDVMRYLPGMTEGIIQRWIQVRSGPDQMHHTEDDPRFTSAEQVRVALGMDPKSWERLAPLITVNEVTSRILSEGFSGKVVRQVQVVVRKGTGKTQIRSWIE
jgi:hypothetical protein